MVTLLKSKINRATVTDANLLYQGSITISKELLDAARIYPYEKVLVVDVTNGARLETYVIVSEKPGVICMNGAAAHLIAKGDIVIIMAFSLHEEPIETDYCPRVVSVNSQNRMIKHPKC